MVSPLTARVNWYHFSAVNRNVNLLVIKLSIFNFLKCYETCNTKIFSYEKGLQEGNWLTVFA